MRIDPEEPKDVALLKLSHEPKTINLIIDLMLCMEHAEPTYNPRNILNVIDAAELYDDKTLKLYQHLEGNVLHLLIVLRAFELELLTKESLQMAANHEVLLDVKNFHKLIREHTTFISDLNKEGFWRERSVPITTMSVLSLNRGTITKKAN